MPREPGSGRDWLADQLVARWGAGGIRRCVPAPAASTQRGTARSGEAVPAQPTAASGCSAVRRQSRTCKACCRARTGRTARAVATHPRIAKAARAGGIRCCLRVTTFHGRRGGGPRIVSMSSEPSSPPPAAKSQLPALEIATAPGAEPQPRGRAAAARCACICFWPSPRWRWWSVACSGRSCPTIQEQLARQSAGGRRQRDRGARAGPAGAGGGAGNRGAPGADRNAAGRSGLAAHRRSRN